MTARLPSAPMSDLSLPAACLQWFVCFSGSDLLVRPAPVPPTQCCHSHCLPLVAEEAEASRL